MRLLFVILALIISGCSGGDSGSGGTPAASGVTPVTIAIGSGVATGAVAVPNIIQSIRVEAFDARGTRIIGPVVANAPNLNVTMNVPNGSGIVFAIAGFSTANAGGLQVYEGSSSPQTLDGSALGVVVSMSMSIGISATPATVGLGAVVKLAGTVAGAPAPATSPLQWAATGGTLGAAGVNGATIDWTAPATPGLFTITANINPAVNTIHNQGIVGTTVITAVDQTAPMITLTGSASVTVKKGSVYTDSGATAIDNIDGIITANITTVNPVNTAVLGVYTVTYSVSDAAGNAAAQVTRSVNVIPTDQVAPVITLSGAANVIITLGTVYSDAGATALDDVNGNLTPGIITSNPVNTAVVGLYTVTYDVIDVAGNAANQVTRSVTVTATDLSAPVISLNGQATVTLIQGSIYTDLGATAIDDVDGALVPVVVAGLPANPVVVGVYPVTYNISDAAGNAAIQVTRTVTVVASDATPPLITLNGANPISIAAGMPYVDPGATAIDNVDGDITVNMTVVNTVNSAIAGTSFTVTYSVSDAAGNGPTVVVRTVNVSVDADNDGVPDVDEVAFGSDPNVAEFDHDGDIIFTRTELALGSDPLSLLSRPIIAGLLGQTNSLGVQSANAITNSGRNGDTNPYGLSIPNALDIDMATNRLFVADSDNNRIVVFQLSVTNAIASRKAVAVIGQADFEHNQADRGNVASATTLDSPGGVAFFDDGVKKWLVVTDSGNHRTLIYDITAGVSTGMAASVVLGQVTMSAQGSGISATAMNFPVNADVMTFGANTYLIVCDSSNNRTLLWDVTAGINTLTNGQAANFVLGQATFTANGAAVSAVAQNNPGGLVQWNNHLFISDRWNHRVLGYNLGLNAVNLGNNIAASVVLGQAAMTTSLAATSATALRFPHAIAVDAVKNVLFVADHDNMRVMAYNLNVLATGMAASFVYGQADMASQLRGLAQNRFGNSWGLAVGANNLFVSDDWDDEILSFDLTNLVTVDIPGVPATYGPLAVNNIGQTNWVPGMVDGNELSVWDAGGSNDTGPTSLANPKDATFGLVLGVPYLFVADELNDRVVAFQSNAAGVPVDMQADLVFGQYSYDHDGGNLTQWGMSRPRGIAFDSASSTLFVSDTLYNRVLTYDLSLGWGQGGVTGTGAPVTLATNVLGQSLFTTNAAALTSTGLNNPHRMTIGTVGAVRYLFVTDRLNGRVMLYNLTDGVLNGEPAAFVLGAPLFTSPAGATAINRLFDPYGIDFDQATGRLFVADGTAARVMIWDLSAGITNGMNASFMLGQTVATVAGNTPAAVSQWQFDRVNDVSFDSLRNVLWVADINNSRMLGFDLSGGITNGMNASYVIGQPDYVTITSYLGDHNRTSYTSAGPSGLTMGPQGHLILVDELDDRVLVIAP